MGKIIDISKWQGKIDFSKASKEIDLAILRASVGLSKDERYIEYTNNLTQYNIPYGAYHYTYLTDSARAKQEAEFFYNATKDTNPSFWVLDLEDSKIVNLWNKNAAGRNQIKKAIKTFVETLREKGAKRVVLYTWQWWGEALSDEEYDWAWRWYASYGKNTGVPTTVVKGCQLHQYTSTGKVSGINTNVDLNQLVGGATLEQLIGEKTSSTKEENVDTNNDRKIIRVTKPKTWNVRKGPSTKYESIGFAQVGQEFDYIATAENGWFAILFKEKTIGWISNSSADLIEI